MLILIVAAAFSASVSAQVVTPEPTVPAAPESKPRPKGPLNPTQSEPLHTSKHSARDSFATKAAQGGLAEVELGKLAAEKGNSDAVKDFADHMVTDHSAANDELKALAQKKGLKLPASLNASGKALYNRLSALSGDKFDRAYINAMVEDHRKDAAEFKSASIHASDPDLKAFATRTLPAIEDHLKMAEQIQAHMKSQ